MLLHRGPMRVDLTITGAGSPEVHQHSPVQFSFSTSFSPSLPLSGLSVIDFCLSLHPRQGRPFTQSRWRALIFGRLLKSLGTLIAPFILLSCIRDQDISSLGPIVAAHRTTEDFAPGWDHGTFERPIGDRTSTPRTARQSRSIVKPEQTVKASTGGRQRRLGVGCSRGRR